MRDRSVADITGEYLPLLKKKENDENLKIVELKEMPGCKPGDNFMSVIIRTELKGVFGNGNPFEKYFITKRYPANGKLVTLVRTRDLFCNEAHTYKILLPVLGAKSLAPECYYANSEKIIMEDLARDNFSIRDRRHLLDYSHCRHVVQALAQFHASSLKVKLNNPDLFERLMLPISEVVFPSDSNPYSGRWLERSVKTAVQSLETIESQSEEIQKSIRFLKKNLYRAYNIVRESTSNQGAYDVLIHGDVWNNNILFSYDTSDKENMRVKFVDFQAVRRASPALDFHYFMYTSAKSIVLENNYGDLVQLYHRMLCNELQFQIPEEHYEIINFEWFERELRKHAVYGLFFALSLVHVVLADDESITITISENGQELNTKLPITAVKTERIENIVSHYIRTFGDAA